MQDVSILPPTLRQRRVLRQVPEIVAGVRAHGSYKAYVREPHRQFLRLRSCSSGAARPGPTKDSRCLERIARLPNGACWHVPRSSGAMLTGEPRRRRRPREDGDRAGDGRVIAARQRRELGRRGRRAHRTCGSWSMSPPRTRDSAPSARRREQRVVTFRPRSWASADIQRPRMHPRRGVELQDAEPRVGHRQLQPQHALARRQRPRMHPADGRLQVMSSAERPGARSPTRAARPHPTDPPKTTRRTHKSSLLFPRSR